MTQCRGGDGGGVNDDIRFDSSDHILDRDSVVLVVQQECRMLVL